MTIENNQYQSQDSQLFSEVSEALRTLIKNQTRKRTRSVSKNKQNKPNNKEMRILLNTTISKMKYLMFLINFASLLSSVSLYPLQYYPIAGNPYIGGIAYVQQNPIMSPYANFYHINPHQYSPVVQTHVPSLAQMDQTHKIPMVHTLQQPSVVMVPHTIVPHPLSIATNPLRQSVMQTALSTPQGQNPTSNPQLDDSKLQVVKSIVNTLDPKVFNSLLKEAGIQVEEKPKPEMDVNQAMELLKMAAFSGLTSVYSPEFLKGYERAMRDMRSQQEELEKQRQLQNAQIQQYQQPFTLQSLNSLQTQQNSAQQIPQQSQMNPSQSQYQQLVQQPQVVPSANNPSQEVKQNMNLSPSQTQGQPLIIRLPNGQLAQVTGLAQITQLPATSNVGGAQKPQAVAQRDDEEDNKSENHEGRRHHRHHSKHHYS